MTSLLVWTGSKILGVDVGTETVESLAGIIMAWMVSQGIADGGAGGTTRATEEKSPGK